MKNQSEEIETKFYLRNSASFEQHLQSLGAQVVQPRVYELNLRFDTPDRNLTRERRVLRLRQNGQAHLTYKGPGYINSDVMQRLEIEFVVSDFEAAKEFLWALGYEVSVWYEKYRTTYSWKNVLVTLDEMPFGNFSEIEGPDAANIQKAARELGLRWEARILESYLGLFDRLRQTSGLPAKNLSFVELAEINYNPQMLGVQPAD
jgi:adenylate cyclase class 2